MLTPLALKILAGSALFSLSGTAAWPVKTDDYTGEGGDGADCDDATEQYLQVEAYDYHDYPKLTMYWRQLSGPCGAEVNPSDLVSWEATYDVDDGDAYPTDGRVQLNLFVCAPFGEYEIELDVSSSSEEGSTMQQRTAWEIENGPDEYHIWDTVNTDLADVEAYSPTSPGNYVWPLPGTMGYYKIIHAGPMPPLECYEIVPSGTEYLGCFEDSSSDRLIDSDFLELAVQGADGMTPQVCSDYCGDYEFFGVESGTQCFCGTLEVGSAVGSDDCGVEYEDLCTGDSTMACGGDDAIAVYQRTGAPSPVPVPTPSPDDDALDTPSPVLETPAPVEDTPTPSPVPDVPTPSAGSFSLEGCFNDFKDSRLMEGKTPMDVMSAEICFEHCDNGINTHFGTQFSVECWCAVDPDLAQNGDELDPDECDMACAGTTDEFCGGIDKISAYMIDGAGATNDDIGIDDDNTTADDDTTSADDDSLAVDDDSTSADDDSTTADDDTDDDDTSVDSLYVGCFEDWKPRAMDEEDMYVSEEMTNELCITFCGDLGHDFAGTEYSEECWCGDSYDMYGSLGESSCAYSCEGDPNQMCGGFWALSVYSTS